MADRWPCGQTLKVVRTRCRRTTLIAASCASGEFEREREKSTYIRAYARRFSRIYRIRWSRASRFKLSTNVNRSRERRNGKKRSPRGGVRVEVAFCCFHFILFFRFFDFFCFFVSSARGNIVVDRTCWTSMFADNAPFATVSDSTRKPISRRPRHRRPEREQSSFGLYTAPNRCISWLCG